MKVQLSYDQLLDAWTMNHEQVYLNSLADIEEWRSLVTEELKKLGDRKAYLLLDISDVRLDPRMAEHYGQVAQQVVRRYAHAIVRYGVKDPATHAAVSLQGIIN